MLLLWLPHGSARNGAKPVRMYVRKIDLVMLEVLILIKIKI